MIHVVIWNEHFQDQKDKAVIKLYPKGLHNYFAEQFQNQSDFQIQCAWLDQPDNGLPDSVLNNTDVLLWWSHIKNDSVLDSIVDRIVARVHAGMGIIFLHSSHLAKPFKKLLGTTGDHPWRNKGEVEKVWTILPQHPIAKDVPISFELPKEEQYGEPFDIPPPKEIVFISGFRDGSIFRTGLTWDLQHGKMFYFRPGHESYSTYHNPNVLKILVNAIRWAASH
jgi:trehalose utilization protein